MGKLANSRKSRFWISPFFRLEGRVSNFVQPSFNPRPLSKGPPHAYPTPGPSAHSHRGKPNTVFPRGSNHSHARTTEICSIRLWASLDNAVIATGLSPPFRSSPPRPAGKELEHLPWARRKSRRRSVAADGARPAAKFSPGWRKTGRIHGIHIPRRRVAGHGIPAKK